MQNITDIKIELVIKDFRHYGVVKSYIRA